PILTPPTEPLRSTTLMGRSSPAPTPPAPNSAGWGKHAPRREPARPRPTIVGARACYVMGAGGCALEIEPATRQEVYVEPESAPRYSNRYPATGRADRPGAAIAEPPSQGGPD